MHHIFQTNRTTCQETDCDGAIKRAFRPNDDRKGSCCVVYNNLIGPQIGISYKCNCSKCSASYHHGYFVTNSNDTYRESITNSKFYEYTDSTFFNTDIFYEYNLLRFGNGVSCESFCDIYNARFAKSINTLKESIEDKNIGYRTDASIKLQPYILENAFHLFGLQLLVNDDLQKPFIITNTLKQKLKIFKNQKIIVKPKKDNDEPEHKNSTVDNAIHDDSPAAANNTRQITKLDLINGLIDEYRLQLGKIEPLCITHVPVKDGTVMHGAFAVYGDGNQTKQRKKCIYPKTLRKLDETNELSQMEQYNCNLLVCPKQG